MSPKYPKEFLKLCKSVKAKRPKTVIDHILKYGQITTRELKDKYGYNHPPRAIRDVRENGIPLETFRVRGADERMIAAYRFGSFDSSNLRKLSGRTALSKEIKKYLIEKYGCRCSIYLEEMKENELQIDHRVPYEVGGESEGGERNPEDFMLLSGSANRAKSWSCEHCENWNKTRKKELCLSCYWSYPENYSHIALKQIRRVDLIWQDKEVAKYEALKDDAKRSRRTIPKYVKKLIENAMERKEK